MSNKKYNKKYELYINVKETSTGGEPESNESYCQHSDIIKNVKFISVFKTIPDDCFWTPNSFEVSEEVYNSEKIYLVIVRYSDGGSFGSTRGNWDIFKAFTDVEDALKMSQSINRKTLKKDYPEYSKTLYFPWEGYFCSLEDVEVHCFNVLETKEKSQVIYH